LREELGIPLVFSHKEVGQACKIKPMLADADHEDDGGDPVLIEVSQKDSDEDE
jgi:hypothetical protein